MWRDGDVPADEASYWALHGYEIERAYKPSPASQLADALPDGSLSKSTVKRVTALASPPVEAQDDNPHEFGANAEPNPKAKYWQYRARVWQNRAIELGWKITEADTPPEGQSVEQRVSIDAFMAKWGWLILSRCEHDFRDDLAKLAAALSAQAPSEAVAIVGERGSVSWRSDSILPVGTKLYTTPQPGAEALRELVAEWKVRPGVTDAYKISADELESLLGRGGK